MEGTTKKLPMVALRGLTVLPEMVLHFDVSRPQSIRAVQEAMQGEEQEIFLVTQRELQIEQPKQKDVFEVGTIACVKQVVKMPKNMIRVLVVGKQRARLLYVEEEGYMQAEILAYEEEEETPESLSENPMAKNLRELFMEYAMMNGKIPKDAVAQIAGAKSFQTLVAQVAANMPLDFQDLQEILEEDDLRKRYELLAFKIANEMEVMKLKASIQQKVKERMDRHQKEFILREQLKVIREELGEDNTQTEAQEFEEALEKLKAPGEVKEKIQKEINRFKSSLNSPAESGVIRTYIETMLEMPWDKRAEENADIAYAKRSLVSLGFWWLL